jgi:hypothetical protein
MVIKHFVMTSYVNALITLQSCKIIFDIFKGHSYEMLMDSQLFVSQNFCKDCAI